MANLTLKEEIVHQLDELTPEQQQELLDYARRLQIQARGTSGNLLLEHMQDFEFEPGEVDAMMQAIEDNDFFASL